MKDFIRATAQGTQLIDQMEFNNECFLTDVYKMPNGEILTFKILENMRRVLIKEKPAQAQT